MRRQIDGRRGRHADLKGKRFGKLLVIRRAGHGDWGHRKWECRCDCGRRYIQPTHFLTRGLHTQCHVCSLPQHGLMAKYKREYSSWCAMKARCFQENNPGFDTYGGRGITVCDRWLGPCGFVNFVLDMGRRPKGKTLDRKNPEGSYTPDNCRWASSKVQQNNRRCSYTEQELVVLREQAREMAVDSVEAELAELEVV